MHAADIFAGAEQGEVPGKAGEGEGEKGAKGSRRVWKELLSAIS